MLLMMIILVIIIIIIIIIIIVIIIIDHELHFLYKHLNNINYAFKKHRVSRVLTPRFGITSTYAVLVPSPGLIEFKVINYYFSS